MSSQKEYFEEEIKNFQAEQDKIKKIIGRIGGTQDEKNKLLNILFLTFVIISFSLAFIFEGVPRMIAIDVGLLLLSIKISYFLHQQMKISHFQFWILNSIEWRINKLSKDINEMKEALKKDNMSGYK